MMAFGAMTAVHLPILLRSLLVISMKTKRAIFGLVQKGIVAKLRHFPGMKESPCLIKSQR